MVWTILVVEYVNKINTEHAKGTIYLSSIAYTTYVEERLSVCFQNIKRDVYKMLNDDDEIKVGKNLLCYLSEQVVYRIAHWSMHQVKKTIRHEK